VQSVIQHMGKNPAAGLDPELALEVARNAGAGAFVSGALMRVGPSRLRLDVRVQDTDAGQILFSEKLEGEDVNAVFAMVDALTGRMAQRFLPGAKLPEKAPTIEEAATSNVEAYRHYQLGRDYLRRFLAPEAIRELEEAVRLDPQFALAYLEIVVAYSLMGDLKKGDAARATLAKMESRLPRKERLAYQAQMAQRAGDREGSRRARESLLAEFPRETNVRYGLANSFQYENQGDRSLSILREGLRLDPKDHLLLNYLCYFEARAGNLAAALQANDQYAALLPKDPNPWDTRGDVLYESGQHEEAVAAYRKVLDLKPDFQDYEPYLKLAVVYADEKKFALAESALQEYARRIGGLRRVYLPRFEGQLQEARGQLEAALNSYRKAVVQLGRAGQNAGAGDALVALGRASVSLGEGAAALSFARQQKLEGEEYAVISWLQAAQGDLGAAEQSLKQYAAAHPWLAPAALDLLRTTNEMQAAVGRSDGRAALAAAGRLPDLNDPLLLLLRARAQLLLKDYAAAEGLLRRALSAERDTENYNRLRTRSPLIAAMCHFYLGQVYEGAAKREQAVNEYQEFLSHFESSRTRLPQVAEARAALKRLVP
jgi:eukaryotic-like serine/threonine-protein kinase